MDAPDVTQLLNDEQGLMTLARQDVFQEIYQHLKQIAHGQRAKMSERGFNTTALVNEAWLKTQASDREFADRNHFFAYSALAMRHILIDQARRNQLVTFVNDETLVDRQPVFQQSEYLIELDRQLQLLKNYSPRLEAIFTFHFFGEMTFDSIAAVLKISSKTAKRDWNKAKAMLATTMSA
jgi:RNA polymerase sigma factor (TIGR02999 family)